MSTPRIALAVTPRSTKCRCALGLSRRNVRLGAKRARLVLDTGDEVGVVPAAAAAADTVFDDGDLGEDDEA